MNKAGKTGKLIGGVVALLTLLGGAVLFYPNWVTGVAFALLVVVGVTAAVVRANQEDNRARFLIRQSQQHHESRHRERHHWSD